LNINIYGHHLKFNFSFLLKSDSLNDVSNVCVTLQRIKNIVTFDNVAK